MRDFLLSSLDLIHEKNNLQIGSKKEAPFGWGMRDSLNGWCTSMMLLGQHKPQALRNFPSTLGELCYSSEGKNYFQPGPNNVYLIKWPATVHTQIYFPFFLAIQLPPLPPCLRNSLISIPINMPSLQVDPFPHHPLSAVTYVTSIPKA